MRKLHYGDLYAGVPAFQVLTITNVSKEELDVLLSTDAQGEVSFDILPDSHDPTDANNKDKTPGTESENGMYTLAFGSERRRKEREKKKRKKPKREGS